jgi:hypothetical protein
MAAVATIDRQEGLRHLSALSAELERAPADRDDLYDRESRLACTAQALGEIGADARSALPAATAIPAVTRLLNSPDEAAHVAATATLAAIRVPSAR